MNALQKKRLLELFTLTNNLRPYEAEDEVGCLVWYVDQEYVYAVDEMRSLVKEILQEKENATTY